MALMEQAAGQGHAYAMDTLGSIHSVREEHVLAMEWATKAAEAGLPDASREVMEKKHSNDVESPPPPP